MDPITHTLGGALIAKTIKTDNKRFWILCFLGEAPDLDVFLAPLGPWAFFLQHRGLSHSLVGVLMQAVFFSLLFSSFDRDTFSRRTLQYSAPLFFHLFCDWATSYGLPLLSPFSFKNYQGDIATSVNLVPIVFMSTGLWLMRAQISPYLFGRPRTMWFAWLFYFLLSLGGRIYAYSFVPIPREDLNIVPTLINPFDLAVVHSDKKHNLYHCYRVNLFEKTVVPRYTITMPTYTGPVQESMAAKEVQNFFRENRWPVVRVTTLPQGSLVEWGSLLFSTRGFVRGKVRVTLDEKGTIMNSERYFGFWNPRV